MSFRVWSAEGLDGAAWRELLERFPARSRDLHYSPDYGLVYRDTYGHEPLLVSCQTGSQLVIQAIVRRSLSSLPFLADCSERARYTDVATPYGFGGPLILDPQAASAEDALIAFDRAYRDWSRAQGIATEFVCLHPLLGNHEPIERSALIVPSPQKAVVAIDATQSESALWASISRGTRSSIQRARREGVVVEQVQPDAAALAAFFEIYTQTMRRRQAAAHWFFPPSYFPACVRRLGPGSSALFFARCQGELAAAYLLLNDANTAYYHFGASDERWLGLRPNNLLMYETLLWVKRRGLPRYHLGGGVTAAENDSLLRFKSSFGGYRALLYTYGRVLDDDVYRRLCALKSNYERRSSAPIADPDYFPLYRR